MRERFFPGLSCAGTMVPEMTRATLSLRKRRLLAYCPGDLYMGPSPFGATVPLRKPSRFVTVTVTLSL